MDKLIFGTGVAIFAGIISSLVYAWMVLLNYPDTWLNTVLILQIIGIITISFIEAFASSTNGASGWMLFLFILFNILLAIGFSILKFFSLIFL